GAGWGGGPVRVRAAGPGRGGWGGRGGGLAADPWRMSGGGGGGAVRARGRAELATVRLGKEYRLSGVWDSLKVRRGPHGWPAVRWEPLTLRAVDDVTLSLGAAETLALGGESGGGKATLGLAGVGAR